MQTRTETITSPSGPMGIHVVRPEGEGPFPVVVFFHHGPGLEEGSKQTMARIAEWGYYVVSHDRYHRAEPWYAMKSPSDDEMKKMFGLVLGTTEAEVAEDLGALLEWLPSDSAARSGPMGCIGYCIGARSVLCTIRDHGDLFRAGVGLHPSFCTTEDPDSPHLAVPSYTGSLYIGFGSADTMQPASDNTALIEATDALAKGEAEIHDGADHGFGVYGEAYHEAAATRSYDRAKDMFDRELNS
ncbi:MAG: dienelactone hydrolase family protein [Acidimicrobiia bacterium]|nr:dienelactone hydrolase family protein [Acidimicrobiia bacterium]